jgi:hypothetical protein
VTGFLPARDRSTFPETKSAADAIIIDMRFLARISVAFVASLLCVGASAQTMTVDQLVEFMRSSIKFVKEKQTTDSKLADSLKNVKLTQKLEDRVIEELQTEGLPPRTVNALRALAASSANLPVAEVQKVEPPAPPPEEPPPSREQQQKILDEAREYALNYSKSLPNFICAQSTKRFDNNRMYDNVLAKLTYYEQHEKYDTISVNDKLTNKEYNKLDGSISTGEFGSMLMGIFDPHSDASFSWSTWKTVGSHKTYVFKFSVDQPHSRWEIEDRQAHIKITPGYNGFVWIDVKDNSVIEFTMKAVDLPSTFAITEADSRLHYDTVQISGISFVLPSRAVMHLVSGRDDQKNEITFHNYQKYSADATLKFDDPVPDEKK